MPRMHSLTLLALAFLWHPAVADNQLVFCGTKQVFADCTRAPCKPAPNGDVVCKCRIRDQPSVSLNDCIAPQGKALQSRYYPLRAYQICPNKKTWANCLGSPCTKNADGTASCACPTTQTNNFIIALPTDHCSMARCNDDKIYSSAKADGPDGAEAMTSDFEHLPPPGFPNFHPPKICPAPTASGSP
jgi:hypothetical protein